MNEKKRCWDSFNAYRESLKKVGAAFRSFYIYVHHSAAAAKKFHEDMGIISGFDTGIKTEEGK